MASPSTQDQRASRACVECHTSKTKCIWPSEIGVGKCRRCSRSKRVCKLAEVKSRRKATFLNRVGQLEERIDGIVSLLSVNQQAQSRTPAHCSLEKPRLSPTSLDCSSGSTAPQDYGQASQTLQNSRIPNNESPINTTTASEAPQYLEIIPGCRIGLDEGDRLLHLYRQSYSPFFPFVPIPSTIDAYELHLKRPLLFKAVMHVVAPQSYLTQDDFGRWFKRYLAHHVILEQEKNLDILQALLLHIAWANFKFYRGSEATNLLQLAIGQVIDLGLSQPAKAPNIPPPVLNEVVRLQNLKIPSKHSFDEMRAMLGCFFLSSTMSILFRRMLQFPYTNYMGACCIEVGNTQQYDSDLFLIALIRMQRLACHSRTIMPHAEIDGFGPCEFSPALYMAMSSIRKELESIKDELPQLVKTNFFFQVIYSGILMSIYEPTICSSSSLSSTKGPAANYRSEALWHCFEAAKRFHEAFLFIPVEKLPYLPFPSMAYFSFNISTTNWLLFTSDADWNSSIARKNLDFAEYLDRLKTRYKEAESIEIASEQFRKRKFWNAEMSVSRKCHDKLQLTRSWYLSITMPTSEASTSSSEMEEVRPPLTEFMSVDELDLQFWDTIMNEEILAILPPGSLAV